MNILCFGYNTRFSSSRRSFQLMRHLALQDDVRTVLYIEAPLSLLTLPREARRGNQRIFAARLLSCLKGVRDFDGTRRFFLFPPLTLLSYFQYGADAPRLRRVSDGLICRQVQRVVHRLDMERSLVLWIYPPLASQFMGKFGEAFVVYDRHDDGGMTARLPAALLAEARLSDRDLTRTADLIFVASQYLHDRLSRLTDDRRVVVLPCAAQIHLFLDRNESECPESIADIPRPIIGYVGAITSERLDVPLIAHVARELSGMSLVFVGPISDDVDLSTLAPLRNVHFTGEVPYQQVPSFLHRFDLAVIPHLVNETTSTMDPIKLYEYLAAGKPIVSTPVAGVERFPRHVAIASNPAEFCKHLRDLWQRNASRESVDACAGLLREHSWASRAATCVQHIKSKMT